MERIANPMARSAANGGVRIGSPLIEASRRNLPFFAARNRPQRHYGSLMRSMQNQVPETEIPMLAITRCALAVLTMACTGLAAAGQVAVSFVDAGTYTDMNKDRWQPSATMDVLAKHLRQLGIRYLPPDQSLKIEILDVDLAGHDEWRRRFPTEIRVLRSVTWPRITLRYVLEQGGNVTRRGEETVADLSYLDHINPYFSDDPFRYEKYMLDRWFRQRFATTE
jgi:hypothetical protein